MREFEKTVLVVGGGAAGYFAAIACARARPDFKVIILEGAANPLAKVRISGGGRCNLTHDCRDPRELTTHYPRGRRELLGPFHRFGPTETLDWFAAEGVQAKTEADGRMFPTTDRSETIIGALVGAAQSAGVRVELQQRVDHIEPIDGGWQVRTRKGLTVSGARLLIACGANPKMWTILGKLGLPMVSPVPSLFSFNTRDKRLAGLAGVSVPNARVRVSDSALDDAGPLLVTHWGLSGPGILRLSAWGARELHSADHRFELRVAWTSEDVPAALGRARRKAAKRLVTNHCPVELPARLWQKLVEHAGVPARQRWAELSKDGARALTAELSDGRFAITGKSTNKDEFVTAGGVDLRAIDFKRFAARGYPGLHLAGEVLDIDAVTGGFNFQAAWTGGWIAGHAMAE